MWALSQGIPIIQIWHNEFNNESPIPDELKVLKTKQAITVHRKSAEAVDDALEKLATYLKKEMK
jgi:Xaa-Pro aminopeptidase